MQPPKRSLWNWLFSTWDSASLSNSPQQQKSSSINCHKGFVMLAAKRVSEFIDEVAATSPAPGGGSVSALAAALGAALTSMVCHLTVGKKKYEDVQDEMIRALGQADELRAKLTDLIDQDTEAFNAVMRAFGMPKDTEEQKTRRSEAIQEATRQATLVPLRS
jgi:formiminotetrahydrofolate cyclodeaminase